ncbi:MULTISPECIES: hypothetical protein [Clostridium]|nr:hypothetical protein [Clostridium beijerinckii]
MYEFILNQWIMKKYTENSIANCVVKGYIAQDQANTIMAMAQVTTITTS